MAILQCLFKGALVFTACIFVCTASIAQTQTVHWKCKIDTGECIGKVRMTVKAFFGEDAIGDYVITSFPNREYLFEDSSPSRPKKLLHFVKADRYLFFGVNGQEEANALRDRYQDKAGRVLIVVLISMAGAFPEGEDAFPENWETRKLEQQRQIFDVSGKKSGPNRFLFKIQNYGLNVEGEWDASKPLPWPDSEPLAGWTVWGNSPAPVLGEARKTNR